MPLTIIGRSARFIRRYGSAVKDAESAKSVLSSRGNVTDSFSDPGVPRVAITKDKQTIVMYHPQQAIKYEDTIPVPRSDPRYTDHENVESLVREKLDRLEVSDVPLDKVTIEKPWPLEDKEKIPTIMHLANMFYTTKHIWFPNRNLRKRKKEITPDRPRE